MFCEHRFHVDKMSSAHVYLRLNKGQTMDGISEGLLEDCAQLVKANSIQGGMNCIMKYDYIWNTSLYYTVACKNAECLTCFSLACVMVSSFNVGNKVNNIDVVYTPWYNLKKTPSMDVGQVGFHNPKLVR
jgi:hypothetical protein